MYANKSAFWFCFPHNTEMSSFETFSSLKLPGCPGAQYQCSISRKGLLNVEPEGQNRPCKDSNPAHWKALGKIFLPYKER